MGSSSTIGFFTLLAAWLAVSTPARRSPSAFPASPGVGRRGRLRASRHRESRPPDDHRRRDSRARPVGLIVASGSLGRTAGGTGHRDGPTQPRIAHERGSPDRARCGHGPTTAGNTPGPESSGTDATKAVSRLWLTQMVNLLHLASTSKSRCFRCRRRREGVTPCSSGICAPSRRWSAGGSSGECGGGWCESVMDWSFPPFDLTQRSSVTLDVTERGPWQPTKKNEAQRPLDPRAQFVAAN